MQHLYGLLELLRSPPEHLPDTPHQLDKVIGQRRVKPHRLTALRVFEL
jgi:hypothetical protein